MYNGLGIRTARNICAGQKSWTLKMEITALAILGVIGNVSEVLVQNYIAETGGSGGCGKEDGKDRWASGTQGGLHLRGW